jgi:hypothetical protein
VSAAVGSLKIFNYGQIPLRSTIEADQDEARLVVSNGICGNVAKFTVFVANVIPRFEQKVPQPRADK